MTRLSDAQLAAYADEAKAGWSLHSGIAQRLIAEIIERRAQDRPAHPPDDMAQHFDQTREAL